jgi:L-lactate dehydrogenase (cytochrome)
MVKSAMSIRSAAVTPSSVSSASASPSLARTDIARSQQRRLNRILALEDFDAAAKAYLPRMIHGFIDGAVETGAAQKSAARAYEDYAFVPRTLVDVSRRNQERVLFGRRYAAPFGIPPLGGAAVAAYRGDIVLARAAALMNQPMIMSASSLIRLEEVRVEYPGAWFQAYLAGDDARIDAMIDRVAAAGFETLVITVDTPVPGNRENNVRNGYSMPVRIAPRVVLDCALHPRWLIETFARTFIRHGMPHFENMDAVQGPPMLSRNLARNLDERDRLAWPHIEAIRKRWPGKLVIKGVLAVPDATRAKDIGADGLIVSSHGGRQLDHAVAPLKVFPRIKSAVGDLPVMIDGGIRRGTDVLKAIALGADFVWVGRPMLFAAAIAGCAGVVHAMTLLREEISRNMAMLGVTSLDDLDTTFLAAEERARFFDLPPRH